MRVALFTFLLVPLLLAGCARTTEVSTRFLDEEPAIGNNRLLLAARTPEEGVRRQWESTCAEPFRQAGFHISRSTRHISGWFEAGSAELEQWARDNDHGLILVSDLTNLVITPEPARMPEDQGRARGPDRRMEPTWTIELGPDRQDPRDEVDRAQELEARLLTAEGIPLWEVVTRTEEANEVRAVARSQCRALLRAMKENRLTPGQRVPE